MKNRIISIGIMVLFVVGSFSGVIIFISEEATASTWIIETVDSIDAVGTFTSLALDDNGYAHISYYNDTSDDLKYAKWNGIAWSTETVDNAGYVGMHSSIALDSNDYPHISYLDYSNFDVKYAKWTGGAWSIETVDSAGDLGYYTSLALDSGDNAHISYYDTTNYDLKYANWTGSSWNIETVDSANSVGAYSSIALDSNDYPHISYYDTTLDDLKYARWTGSTWAIQSVTGSGDSGSGSSIALDSNDYPHISYYIGSPAYDTMYARWNGSAWNISTVDGANGHSYPTSIAINSSDYPHIAYQDSSKGTIKYARWNGSAWRRENIDYGMYASIALDNIGYPHISYFGTVNWDLKYAKFSPAPSAPRNLQALADGDQVNLTWDAPSSEGESPITNYIIYRGTTPDGESFLVEIGNVLNYSDKGLTYGQIYYYKVTAKNVYGESLFSYEVNATPVTFPDEPRNLATLAGDSYVTLTWNVPIFDGGSPITNYRIYRGTSPGGENFLIEIGNVLYYNDTGVTNGITYYYKVSAKNAVGEGQLSDEVNAIPIGNCILLYQGWNLISIPYIQSDTNLLSVLFAITGYYDAVQWYNASGNSDHWEHNNTSKPEELSDLNDIDHIMGFWIHITQSGDTIFYYNGTQPTSNQTIILYPGWNLVGYPSITSYNRTEGLNNLTFGTHVDSIWTYNAATQKWKELGPSDYFAPGKGYWIHAQTSCVWEVPI